jgi:hypothetical protein
VPKGGVLTRSPSVVCEDDRGTRGAGISAAGSCTRDVGEVNMAERAAAAKPLRPTPAIPAAPPDLVSISGDTKDREE